jgi:hypothetical protein
MSARQRQSFGFGLASWSSCDAIVRQVKYQAGTIPLAMVVGVSDIVWTLFITEAYLILCRYLGWHHGER